MQCRIVFYDSIDPEVGEKSFPLFVVDGDNMNSLSCPREIYLWTRKSLSVCSKREREREEGRVSLSLLDGIYSRRWPGNLTRGWWWLGEGNSEKRYGNCSVDYYWRWKDGSFGRFFLNFDGLRFGSIWKIWYICISLRFVACQIVQLIVMDYRYKFPFWFWLFEILGPVMWVNLGLYFCFHRPSN